MITMHMRYISRIGGHTAVPARVSRIVAAIVVTFAVTVAVVAPTTTVVVSRVPSE